MVIYIIQSIKATATLCMIQKESFNVNPCCYWVIYSSNRSIFTSRVNMDRAAIWDILPKGINLKLKSRETNLDSFITYH